MMDLSCVSKGHGECSITYIPSNRSLHFEPVLAIDVSAQCILYGDALEEVGWLYQCVKTRLLGHGDCDS